jgi:hypothetical protein
MQDGRQTVVRSFCEGKIMWIDLKQRIARGLLQAAGIQVVGSGNGVINGITISVGNDDKDGDGEGNVIAVATEAWSNIKPGATHNNPLVAIEPAVILNAEDGDNSRQNNAPRATINTVWKKGVDGNQNKPVHIKNSSVIWNTAQAGVSIDTLIRNEVPIKYLFDLRSADIDHTGCHAYDPVRGHYFKIRVDGVEIGLQGFVLGAK